MLSTTTWSGISFAGHMALLESITLSVYVLLTNGLNSKIVSVNVAPLSIDRLKNSLARPFTSTRHTSPLQMESAKVTVGSSCVHASVKHFFCPTKLKSHGAISLERTNNVTESSGCNPETKCVFPDAPLFGVLQEEPLELI